MYPKFYIGPMSKNIVDAIIEFCKETNNNIGIIPSRRQIEWDGGYVNNWTTKQFNKYIKKQLIIKRDHAGPDQGYNDDDGYKSLEEDCKFFPLIHIDPWKKYPKYEDGLQHTIDMINFCYKINQSIQYEVGTEQSIRYFGTEQIDMLLNDLKNKLKPKIFNKIKYIVIQSGTSLKENTNTGNYNSVRLKQMINIAKKYNKLSKEHNGDYIPIKLIKEKMDLGLNSINIAPEFGLIETQTYIDSGIDIDKFWEICYGSKRWQKWVSSDFDPFSQKEELIKICGHYVLSDPQFLKIKPNIDNLIKEKIKEKLNQLYE
tara:strand:+ start:175 stop:1119 length:945 start_codon:yes stop_codon:yes gene_type:complete